LDIVTPDVHKVIVFGAEFGLITVMVICQQYIYSSLIKAMTVGVLVSACKMTRDVVSGSNTVLIQSA
jgi:hypothetical protein